MHSCKNSLAGALPLRTCFSVLLEFIRRPISSQGAIQSEILSIRFELCVHRSGLDPVQCVHEYPIRYLFWVVVCVALEFVIDIFQTPGTTISVADHYELCAWRTGHIDRDVSIGHSIHAIWLPYPVVERSQYALGAFYRLLSGSFISFFLRLLLDSMEVQKGLDKIVRLLGYRRVTGWADASPMGWMFASNHSALQVNQGLLPTVPSATLS